MVRGRINWSTEEEAAIRDGVSKYGAGKWCTILNDPEFSTSLKIRTNVDLKDKWRNMNLTKGECRNSSKSAQKNIKKTSRRYNKSASLTSEGSDKHETAQPEAPAIIHKSSEDGDSGKLMLRWKVDDSKPVGQTNLKQPSSSAQKQGSHLQEKLPPPNSLITYSRRNVKTDTADGKVNKKKLPPPNLKVFSRRNKKAVTTDDGKVNEREMECDVTASDSLPAAVDANLIYKDKADA